MGIDQVCTSKAGSDAPTTITDNELTRLASGSMSLTDVQTMMRQHADNCQASLKPGQVPDLTIVHGNGQGTAELLNTGGGNSGLIVTTADGHTTGISYDAKGTPGRPVDLTAPAASPAPPGAAWHHVDGASVIQRLK